MTARTVALPQVADLVPGYPFDAAQFNNAGDGMPVVRIRDVLRGYAETHYSGDYSHESVVANGDFLVGMDGEFNMAVWQGGKALLNQRVCKIVPKPNEIDPSYLLRCLPRELKRIEDRTPFVTVKHLSMKELRAIQLSLPPLPEQRRLAAILDKADAIRRKRREALKLADKFLRATFIDLFGDPVRNTKGWAEKTIGEIAPGRGDIVDGPFGSSLKPEHYVNDGIRVIRNFNIKPGWFDASAFKYVTPEKFQEIRRSEVGAGDLLISTKGTVGTVCLMPELKDKSVLSATGTVRIRINAGRVNPEFLMYQMLMPQYQEYIKANQAGAVQQYLNLAGIRAFQIIDPPMELQSAFVMQLRGVNRLRARMESCLEESMHLFQSVSHRAFQGTL